MHIPSGMLNGQICPLSAGISAVGIAVAAWRAFFSQRKPTNSRFAAITALIFAGQMMNFPINNGTSGHLLGGILAATLLGIPFGILSMAIVVTIQCLVFADGGLSVLGANILNMAIVGAGLGGAVRVFFNQRFSSRLSQNTVNLGITAWLSVMIAALLVSIELAISGTIPFFRVITAMLGTHAFIGIGEAFITVAAYYIFAFDKQEVSARKTVALPLVASGIIAFMLSPFASALPDGLEWVAGKYQFLHEATPMFVSPFSDYAISGFTNEILSTGLAGLSGVVITFLVAWFLAKLLRQPLQVSSK